MKVDIKLNAKIKKGKFHNYLVSEKHTTGKHETTLFVDGVEIYRYKYGLFYNIKKLIKKLINSHR